MTPMSRRAAFLQPVTALSDRVKSADALLIATPEYNFSIPGVLKNVIDWLSRPPLDAALARKPVAIVGAGGRLGSARAQYHLRQVCGCLSMLPVPRPEVFVLSAWEQFDAQGRLKDAADDKAGQRSSRRARRLDAAAAAGARASHDRSLLLADLERAQDHDHAP